MSQSKHESIAGNGQLQQIKSYSGYYECIAELLYPTDKESLCKILAQARQQKRKVSFREEGYSLDAQGLNSDLLIWAFSSQRCQLPGKTLKQTA
jgi:hypothetical protein